MHKLFSLYFLELLNTSTTVHRAGYVAAGAAMLIGSCLMFCVSLTSGHKSNQRAIRHARHQVRQGFNDKININ